MRSHASVIAVSFLLVLCSVPLCANRAQAITYAYTGICTVNCGSIGLSVGGSVSGSLTFADSSLIGGNPYPVPSGFSFDFGSVDIDNLSAKQFFIAGVVPPDLNSFANAQSVTEAISSASGDTIFTNSNPPWSAGRTGGCTNIPGQCVIVEAASGTGQWHRVPAPSTLVMLLSALAVGTGGWIGHSRFRRRHLQSADVATLG